MRILSAVLVGLVFGVGIAISGMINPAKVLNFFDIAGTWDPSLIFVMGGALLTTFIGYRLVLKRPGPIVEAEFKLPTNTMIDARLIGGSAVFAPARRSRPLALADTRFWPLSPRSWPGFGWPR